MVCEDIKNKYKNMKNDQNVNAEPENIKEKFSKFAVEKGLIGAHETVL